MIFYFLARSSASLLQAVLYLPRIRGMRRRHGDVGDFVSNAEQVDCCQSVAPPAMENASLSAIALATISVLCGSSGIRTRQPDRSTEWFSILQDFSQFLSGSITDIQDLPSAFTSLTDFRVAGAVSENSLLREHQTEPGCCRWSADVLLVNQVSFVQGFTHIVALCRDKVLAIPPPTISWSAILDRESERSVW